MNKHKTILTLSLCCILIIGLFIYIFTPGFLLRQINNINHEHSITIMRIDYSPSPTNFDIHDVTIDTLIPEQIKALNDLFAQSWFRRRFTNELLSPALSSPNSYTIYHITIESQFGSWIISIDQCGDLRRTGTNHNIMRILNRNWEDTLLRIIAME